MKIVSKLSLVTAAALLSVAAQAAPSTSAKQCAQGQNWSVVKNSCVRVGQAADVIVKNTLVSSSPIYVILGGDVAELHIKGKAPVVMESVKGGYVSKDGQLHLLNRSGKWSLRVK